MFRRKSENTQIGEKMRARNNIDFGKKKEGKINLYRYSGID